MKEDLLHRCKQLWVPQMYYGAGIYESGNLKSSKKISKKVREQVGRLKILYTKRPHHITPQSKYVKNSPRKPLTFNTIISISKFTCERKKKHYSGWEQKCEQSLWRWLKTVTNRKVNKKNMPTSTSTRRFNNQTKADATAREAAINKNSYSVVQCNIQILRAKYQELCSILRKKKIKVACLKEKPFRNMEPRKWFKLEKILSGEENWGVALLLYGVLQYMQIRLNAT